MPTVCQRITGVLRWRLGITLHEAINSEVVDEVFVNFSLAGTPLNMIGNTLHELVVFYDEHST
jgi:hypothetical protein